MCLQPKRCGGQLGQRLTSALPFAKCDNDDFICSRSNSCPLGNTQANYPGNSSRGHNEWNMSTLLAWHFRVHKKVLKTFFFIHSKRMEPVSWPPCSHH